MSYVKLDKDQQQAVEQQSTLLYRDGDAQRMVRLFRSRYADHDFSGIPAQTIKVKFHDFCQYYGNELLNDPA